MEINKTDRTKRGLIAEDMEEHMPYYGTCSGDKAILFRVDNMFFALLDNKLRFLTRNNPSYVDCHCQIFGKCNIDKIDVSM